MREHLFRECPSVFVAEAVAYFQAMQLSIHLGLREVKIEGDSRSVILEISVGHWRDRWDGKKKSI